MSINCFDAINIQLCLYGFKMHRYGNIQISAYKKTTLVIYVYISKYFKFIKIYDYPLWFFPIGIAFAKVVADDLQSFSEDDTDIIAKTFIIQEHKQDVIWVADCEGKRLKSA